jgi:hypothetical protein
MGTLRPRLAETTFRCDACEFTWEGAPARVVDDESTPWHPWAYFAACPICSEEAPQQPQARHLLKMWAKSTGPRTPEGKAAVTKNIEGHPTPEETLRTRFNAVKHGLRAEVATYFPAKPGGYPHCNGCEYLHSTCRVGTGCQKRTELFLRHRIAFDTKDPSMLTDLRADLHATIQAILSDMLLAVVQDGARLKTPEWYYDQDGSFHLAQFPDPDTGKTVQIYKLEEHPLLKRIGEFVSRIGLDLNSQGMTPKVQDDADVIRGHLDQDGERAEMSLEYQRRQTEMLEKLGGLIDRSRASAAKDPILLERQSADAEEG